MSENIKPLNEKDIPQAQINFLERMAMNSKYLLKHHKIPEDFQGAYTHYIEIGKQ